MESRRIEWEQEEGEDGKDDEDGENHQQHQYHHPEVNIMIRFFIYPDSNASGNNNSSGTWVGNIRVDLSNTL